VGILRHRAESIAHSVKTEVRGQKTKLGRAGFNLKIDRVNFLCVRLLDMK
jgi:hypothetical protein